MPEFTDLLHNAKKIYDKLIDTWKHQSGCFIFFTGTLPSSSSYSDAKTISLVAKHIEDKAETYREYIHTNTLEKPSLEEFKIKKTRILMGIYILIWSRYNSMLSAYLNTSFIELMKKDMEVQSIEDIDKIEYRSSLEELSKYCSFLYNCDDYDSTLIMERLGSSIQVDISLLIVPDKEYNRITAFTQILRLF